ncbi:efflux RND transporter permease subunit [candidate division KSB1 bacterium]|nr:efflux RND transporter permease subunit [candidate division KSB1 bacterium]
MNITKTAIEKNRITATVLILILFAGISTFRTMPRAEDPGFVIRWGLIMTDFPGASPERVEQLVTDKLEKAIQEMPEIDHIDSQSKSGVSIIFVTFKEQYDEMRPIWDKLRRKVERTKNSGELPDGIFGPRVNDEFGDVFGTIVTLTGEGYSYAELKKVADEVRNELLTIDEVAKVEITGAQEERIFVEYNNARLAELGITTNYLMGVLATKNIIMTGGDVSTDYENIILEPTGNFESIDDLKQTLINIPGRSELIYLGDIANIYRGYIDPPQTVVHSSGTPCLALAINMREGGNIINLGHNVKEKIAYLQSVYPIGIEFDFVSFQPADVQKKIDNFTNNLMQAIGVVLLVMLLFLGIRTGLVVASLVPMAMIMSLWVMGLFGIGLDMMSIASLIVALGLLVDNAIVMSESIMVQMAEGKRPVEAAINSANELRIPLLTSSLTTSAAFLPIYLAESGVGEYCAPLFEVVTITLICSWILSLTMIPMLCVYFLKVKRTGDESFSSKFYRMYRASLVFVLKHRWLTIGITVFVFFISMQGFRLVPSIFFPDNDKATYTAEINLPEGTPIKRTLEIVNELEQYMKQELMADSTNSGGIVNWSTYIGQGPPMFVLGFSPEQSKAGYACFIVNTSDGGPMLDTLVHKTEAFCIEHFPEVRPRVARLQYGPPSAFPVEIRILGKDLDNVFQIADQVKEKMETITGTKAIHDDWGLRTKKLLVNINQARAKRAGITNQDIAFSLQTALTGIITTQYREEDEVIPVTLRSVAAERQDIGKLETINVYSSVTGNSVPLKQVADLEIVWEPSKILRRDLLKVVTVKSGVTAESTPIAIALEMDKWLKEQQKTWDVGYRYELGGEMESSELANKSINEKMPIAGLLIVLLLVFQFNSFRRPFIILTTIPLGLIGVVIGLVVMRSYFGFMTLLGVYSLAGVVINNAIVLIDRIRIEQDENGVEATQAIINSAQKRLRPILLTTATTIGGLIPLYWGGGPMWESMAVTIMFGLAFATVLTLGFVPVMYSLLFKVNFKNYQTN